MGSFTIYLDPATELQVRRAAERAGMSLSQWVTKIVDEETALAKSASTPTSGRKLTVRPVPTTPRDIATTEEQPEEEPREKHWIEIELVGEDEAPIPYEDYEIELPDGTKKTGRLDENGLARVDDILDPGSCKVTFPNLDKDAWEPI